MSNVQHGCGCVDEDAKGHFIRHYCKAHWADLRATGSPAYRDALDAKLDTLRNNLRDTYGVEPKGDQ